MAKRRKKKQAEPDPRTKWRKDNYYRPSFSFKVRCCNQMHTIKLVRGAFVMANHADKDQDEAFMVGAILGGKKKIRCHEVKKMWLEHGGWGEYRDARRTATYRRRQRKGYLDTVRVPGANGVVRTRYTGDSLEGRTTPKDRLRREIERTVEAYWRMTRYHTKEYYRFNLKECLTVGDKFVFKQARTSHSRKSQFQMQLPYSWRREVAEKKLAVIDGHFIVKVLEELETGYRVLAIRLVRHESWETPTPDRKLLLEKPEDLQMATVIPVVAEAMAYKRQRTDKLQLVWAAWKKPIRAKEER